MKKAILITLSAMLLLIPAWLLIRFLGVGSSSWNVVAIALSVWLLALVLMWASRRMSIAARIAAGLLVLAGLLPPTAMLVENFPNHTWLDDIQGLLIFCMPSLAIIAAALLLDSGLHQLGEQRKTEIGRPGPRTQGYWLGWLALMLGGLLIAKVLINIYWLIVWDDTTNSLDFLWLIVPFLAVLTAVDVLLFSQHRQVIATIVYALVIPAMLLTVYAGAQRASFRQVTETHAARVIHALETYHARTGRYPQDLRQLNSWYQTPLPHPVVIYGQDWCYDSNGDAYRLGYVDREHWSSPDFTGPIIKAQGQLPDLPPICAAQIESLRNLKNRLNGGGAGSATQ